MASCAECDREFETEGGLSVHYGHEHGPHTEECVRCGEDFRVPPNKADKVEQCSGCRQKFGHTERRNRQISKSKLGYSHSEGAKEKMSESHSGKTLSEKHCRNISEAMSGEGNPQYGNTGKSHPSYGNTNSLDSEWEIVGETGHPVKSSWEKEIDLLLYGSDYDHSYESETFDFGDFTYTPDFFVKDFVIEVKGFPRESCQKKGERFMEECREYTYILLGNKQSPYTNIPCDIHIPWDERNRLIEEIENV